MIKRDKKIESSYTFRHVFSVVENFLHEASSAFSVRYEALNDITNVSEFKIPLPKRWGEHDIVKFNSRSPTHLNRNIVDGGFKIKLTSQTISSYLSLEALSWGSMDGEKSVISLFTDILTFISSEKKSHTELYVYITIKNESYRDCFSYSVTHRNLAIKHGFCADLISHKHLLIEVDGVFVHVLYFPYQDIRQATYNNFSQLRFYISNFRCSDMTEPFTQKKDESFIKDVCAADEYAQYIEDFLSFGDKPLVKLYSAPLSVSSRSFIDIKEMVGETSFTKHQYLSMKYLAILSCNLYKIINVNEGVYFAKAEDISGTLYHLIDRLQVLCSNPSFYMHKQSAGNITKHDENTITSFLCSLLHSKGKFTVHQEVMINNGRADIKLVNSESEETFLIECKILGSKINKNNYFMKHDSVSFRKAIRQVRQYLSSNNDWHGFIVIYAFDVYRDVILKCIKHSLSNISKQLEFDDELVVEPFGDEILGLPVFKLYNSELSVRLIICTLHTTTPTNADALT
ncbi:PD-(D/E)XK nuclease domain-containing protein [Aeromonas veronii]|uniref:PD-(D/E)XK nuclease domain-containing protein n=1 Tax=Aeromonas veronii TaxID=654 RepID=UPI003D21DA13